MMKTDNSTLRPGERVPRDHGIAVACFLTLAVIAAIIILRGTS